MSTSTVDLSHLDMVVEGTPVSAVELDNGYVSKFFSPHIGQHSILTGNQITEGMVVLIVDPLVREDPAQLSDENLNDHRRNRIDETSRWALVHNPRISMGDILNFTAIYADGTMRQRHYNVSYRWAVASNVVFTAKRSGEEEFIQSMTETIEKLLFGENHNLRERTPGSYTDFFSAMHGFPTDEETSPAEEEPYRSPTNFARDLRDASSLKQVKEVLALRKTHRIERFRKAPSDHKIRKLTTNLLDNFTDEEVLTALKNYNAIRDIQRAEELGFPKEAFEEDFKKIEADKVRLNDVLQFAGTRFNVQSIEKKFGMVMLHFREIASEPGALSAMKIELKPNALVEVLVSE